MVAVAYAVERQLPKLQHAGTFALAGFTGIFLGQLMYLLGVYYSGAILSAICQLIQAPLVASLAVRLVFFSAFHATWAYYLRVLHASVSKTCFPVQILFKMEKFSWLKMAGLVTSLAGSAVLILGGGLNIGFSAEGAKSLGVLLLVAQNIFSSFMIILQKQLTADNGPMTTAAFITFSSVPWTALTGAVTISGVGWKVSPTAIWGLSYAILIIGLVAGNLYGWALKHMDSSVVGASVTLNVRLFLVSLKSA